MNIQEALKPTGKAIYSGQTDVYVEIRFDNGANYLVWVNTEDNEIDGRVIGEEGGRVAYEMHFKDNWQPYHEVKEIRPEKAGELWKKGVDRFVYLIAEEGINKLIAIPSISELLSFNIKEHGRDIIHNKNGWTRLFPPVEDESVEEMKFEAVTWGKCDCGFNYPMAGRGSFQNNDKLLNQPPMEMILIPQEA